MKKPLLSLLMITIMVTASLYASPVVASPVHLQGTLTFIDMGLDADIVLRGPYDSREIRFNLPPTWELQAGAELELEISASFTGAAARANDNLMGAFLEVSFNGHLQKIIPLIFGEKSTYRVPITIEDQILPEAGSLNSISFFLDAAVDCNFDFHETTVVISTNSTAYFPYRVVPLSLDLNRLPWPIFLERGNISDPVTLVLPNAPSAEELEAGFIVMGAFGRLTGGKMPLVSITADKLTDAILVQSHLIVVGKPSDFPKLANLKYPVPLIGGIFSYPGRSPDDGIVQMLPSPKNSSRVILMVSGATDQAVIKAAQGVSAANLQTGSTPDYSIIAKVNPLPSIGVENDRSVSPTTIDFQLSDLGYSFVQIAGIGVHWASYQFMIPAEQMPSGDVYLDLNISTSAQVDPKRSEGVVYVNDIQIGSVTLSSDTSNVITSRIHIPLGVIRTGLNTLDLVWNLLPRDACSLFTFNGLWVTIYPDSKLHLPLAQLMTASTPFTLRDLKAFPYPFINDPSLSTTTFVLAKQDPNSWLLAGKIAFYLGTHASGPILGFRAAFDGQTPDDLKTNHLILVGEPKNLSIVADLKKAMPAYYESGSNLAVLESQQVIYRIPDDKSLGYLQLFTSPWNDQAAILGVLGTTPAGLGYAVDAILNASTKGNLAGNFITLDGNHVVVVDTRTGLGLGRIRSDLGPSTVLEESTSPTEAPKDSPDSPVSTYNASKESLLVGIAFIIFLIVLTLVIMAFRLRKKNSGSRLSRGS